MPLGRQWQIAVEQRLPLLAEVLLVLVGADAAVERGITKPDAMIDDVAEQDEARALSSVV